MFAFETNKTKISMADKKIFNKEMPGLEKSNSPNFAKNVHNQQTFGSSTSATKQRVFTKRIRKCHVVKQIGDQSIAPLLETISALAVNSDLSDDEEYQDYQGIVGMHEEDEDGVEDYDFEQNLEEEQKFCSETANKSFGTDQHDNIETASNDLQCSTLSAQLPQHSDLKPVNAYVVSEPFCSPISRVSSSVVNRPRLELSGNANKWSPLTNEPNEAQHCSVANNNMVSGKSVRFNADVQVTSVSPRLAHKVFSTAATSSVNPHDQAFHRLHCIELNRPFEISPNGSNDQHSQNSDIGSNMYDEVASITSLQIPQNVKTANEQLLVNNLLGNRVIRDLSTTELHRKLKKKQPGYEHDFLSQPLYGNIDQTFNEHKEDHKMTNQSNSMVSQQKSILKDPLCAKLRSAIRKGQFAKNDLAQLESEIDSLFHGNDFPKGDTNNIAATSRMNFLDNEEKSTCDMLAGLESAEEFDNGKLFQNKSSCNAFKTSPKKFNADGIHISSDINAVPCNSYIKMIEEKYRNTSTSGNHNKFKSGKNISKVKNIAKHTEFEPKSKSNPEKTMKQFKSKSSTGDKIHLSKFSTSFQLSHPLHQSHANMPMFSATMDQLMNNIIHETSRQVEQTENKTKVKQQENQCKLSVSQNKTTTKKLNKSVAVPFSNDANRRNNLYSFFADPVKGPSINNLMDELSRNSNSFSDNESVKSSASTLSKSLVENHIYEEILYECFENQNQLDSALNSDNNQLNHMLNLTTNPKSISNGLNVTSLMSSLTLENNTALENTFGFPHKI